MKIYLIGGLGADKSVFQKLKSEQHSFHFIDWITPIPNESLSNYAHRLSEQINPDEAFALVGVSFGGMLAVEISKQLSPNKLILISSAERPEELPKYFRWAAALGIHKLLPYPLLKTLPVNPFLFGCTSKESKALLKTVMKNTDTAFLKWAVNAILNWKTSPSTTTAIHLHGDKDYIIPIPKKENCFTNKKRWTFYDL